LDVRIFGCLIACLFCLALGCSVGEQPADVEGTILLNDQPLDEGEIIFEAADGQKTPEAAGIKDGKYTLKVLPGPKIVRIRASRPASIPDPVMGAAAREARISEEFNDKTTLKAEIQAGKNKEVNFNVTERPKPKKG